MHAAGRIGLLALAVLGAASALATTATPATPATGLHGTVRKGPISPVCRVGVPCDAPARVTLVFRRGGAVVARAKTGKLGGYRIALPAGYYSVTTKEIVGAGRAIKPRKVHVRAGHDDRIDFFIDTGIR